MRLDRRRPSSARGRYGGRNGTVPELVDASVARVQLYTTAWCVYCTRARALLEARRVPFEEISLDGDPSFRQRVFELGGRWTVPLVLVDGRPIGGHDELAALDRAGQLAERLAA